MTSYVPDYDEWLEPPTLYERTENSVRKYCQLWPEKSSMDLAHDLLLHASTPIENDTEYSLAMREFAAQRGVPALLVLIALVLS